MVKSDVEQEKAGVKKKSSKRTSGTWRLCILKIEATQRIIFSNIVDGKNGPFYTRDALSVKTIYASVILSD